MLENHRDATVAWPHGIDASISEVNLTGARYLEAGDHAQQGGFSAAGWAQEDSELARRNFQRQIANDLHMTESFGDLPQAQVSHALPPPVHRRYSCHSGAALLHQNHGALPAGPGKSVTKLTQADVPHPGQPSRYAPGHAHHFPILRDGSCARELISHRMPGLRETIL